MAYPKRIVCVIAATILFTSCVWADADSVAPTSQAAIDRVDLMPDRPQPFKYKDFKAIARGCDKLLFDFDAQGQFQPIIWWDDTQYNLPMRGFGFPSCRRVFAGGRLLSATHTSCRTAPRF